VSEPARAVSLIDVHAEGWYRDPYKVHTDRWFSDGEPTELVRDADGESKDPPPDTPISESLIESDSYESADGDDLRRADDPSASGAYDPKKAVERALDSLPWGPVN
jgi:hypothetical protein